MRPRASSSLGERRISRFPCKMFRYVFGVLDRAELGDASRYRRFRCCLPPVLTASAFRRMAVTRLNTRPVLSPVNASNPPLQTAPHDSGPVWIAIPSLCETLIHYTLPVLPAHQDFAKTTEAERFARDALALYARLFRLWRKFQGNRITRDQLLWRSIRLQKDWFALAQNHLDSEDKPVRNLATALFQHSDRLFTFLEHPGVEPTNNCVERALRTGVQWRKTSFGNRSGLGEIATARLLTVSQTCRMQGRNVLIYLGTAISCHRRCQPVPSLLPGATLHSPG